MGTPSRTDPTEVNEIARRRLQSLRRELQQAADEAPPPSAAGPLPDPGRHARTSVTARQRWLAWWAERVPATLRGRVRLGAREVVVLVALMGVGLALAGCFALRSQSGDVVPASAAPQSEPASAQPLVTPAASPGATEGPGAGEVVVDVAGKVRRPGVFTLPPGSRVVDALRKAGGAKAKVDLSALNLARVLTDGEQVLVGQAAAGGVAAGAAAAAGPSTSGGLLSLNAATLEQLDGLPGVGPVTAQKILGWREQNGAFTSVDELLEIDGIGEKTLAELAPLLTL